MQGLWSKAFGSLQERARYFVLQQDKRRLAAELGAPSAVEFPLELLQTVASLKSMLPQRPRVLIDVGAHRGQFSAAAHAVFDLERIYCFEPDRDLHAELRKAIGPERLRLFEVAVSNRGGQTSFYVHRDKTMSSTVAAAPQALADLFPDDDPAAIQVQQAATCTLDMALADEEFAPQDAVLMKIDTQGNELHVLQGAGRVLEHTQSCLVEHMFASPYQRSYQFEDLVELLSRHGFQCQGALSVSRRTRHRVTGVDFLFVKSADSRLT
jgi:FkbM family methyltransferase